MPSRDLQAPSTVAATQPVQNAPAQTPVTNDESASSVADTDQPEPSALPQPTAPFSTSRPGSLSSRVIQPVTTEDNSVDLQSMMDKELTEPNASGAPDFAQPADEPTLAPEPGPSPVRPQTVSAAPAQPQTAVTPPTVPTAAPTQVPVTDESSTPAPAAQASTQPAVSDPVTPVPAQPVAGPFLNKTDTDVDYEETPRVQSPPQPSV